MATSIQFCKLTIYWDSVGSPEPDTEEFYFMDNDLGIDWWERNKQNYPSSSRYYLTTEKLTTSL